MQWSNLYLVESKYKLTLIPSKLKLCCLIAESALLIVFAYLISGLFFNYYTGTFHLAIAPELLNLTAFRELSRINFFLFLLLIYCACAVSYFCYVKKKLTMHLSPIDELFDDKVANKTNVELSVDGYLYLGVINQWRLTTACRIGYLGCYLFVEKIDPLTQQAYSPCQRQRLFVFKDNLQQRDYARLKRIIRKINRLKSIAPKQAF